MAFVERAVSSASPNGVIATLLPVGVLGGEYAYKWRRQLAELAHPRLISSLGDHSLFRFVEARAKQLLSEEHFTVDGTLIQAWAAARSFTDKSDPPAPGSGSGHKSEVLLREKVESKTDKDARLYKKATADKSVPSYQGHALIENRSGLVPAANFSHVLSIYGGHHFDLMFHVVGAPSTVNGILSSQFPKLTLSQTGEDFPNENPDAALAEGRLISGALYSVQVEGGKQNNSGLQIDFTGTEGDLRVTNERLYGNLTDNQIMGAQGSGKALEV